MRNYFKLLQNINKELNGMEKIGLTYFPKDSLNEDIMATNQNFCHAPNYQQYYGRVKSIIRVSHVFGIQYLDINQDYLEENINYLNDSRRTKYKKEFLEMIKDLKIFFKKIQVEATELSRILNVFEKARLNEAIHDYYEGCYNSSTIMAVSTIESKLLGLMKSSNSEKAKKLDKLTLGQLINEYLENEEEYKKVIPDKYEPLLKLCNVYRIFSAHPKKEKINKRVATSILNLTFEFLTDKELNL